MISTQVWKQLKGPPEKQRLANILDSSVDTEGNQSNLKGVSTRISPSSFMQTHLEGGASSKHRAKPTELRGLFVSGATCIRNMCNVWIGSQLLKTAMAHPVFQNCREKTNTYFQKVPYIQRICLFLKFTVNWKPVFTLKSKMETTISSIFTGMCLSREFSFQRNLIQLFTMFEILRFFPKPLAIQFQNLAENREILFFDKSDALDFLSKVLSKLTR